MDETADGDATYEAPENGTAASADEQANAEQDTVFTATLQPADSAAAPAVSGEVAVVAGGDVEEPLELVVKGTGLPPGDHAWHVHTGPCGTSGPVRIPLSETAEAEGITGPIDVDDQGAFEESVEVPELNRTMIGTQAHSLHIHQNPGANHGPTVACATI
jgi:hypothetical protein